MQDKIYGDGEYHLMKEELMRECRPASFGFSHKPGSMSWEPAILLEQPLKDKESYKDRDIQSKWTIAHHGVRIEAIFLDIEFKPTETLKLDRIRICIPESMFCDTLLKWFRLLIQTDGTLSFNDGTGIVQAVIVSNVSLDVPRMILEHNFKM